MRSDETWLSAGNAIMEAMKMESADPATATADIKLLETAVRSVPVSEKEFRKHFAEFKESVVKRAESRGEYRHIGMEVSYFKQDYFLNALVYFLIGTLTALAMWAFGRRENRQVAFMGARGLSPCLELATVSPPS